MSNKRTPDSFVRLLENGVRNVLKSKDASASDKLKAIEVGAKIAAIQARMKAGGDGDGMGWDG